MSTITISAALHARESRYYQSVSIIIPAFICLLRFSLFAIAFLKSQGLKYAQGRVTAEVAAWSCFLSQL